jgi:Uma2 family endonuclease
MSTASVLSVHPGPYTFSDLEAMPEDGQRYELIDGGLHVTPAPTPRHQRVAGRLRTLLDAELPIEFEALEAIDLDCGRDTVLQPDIAVLPSKLVDGGIRLTQANQVLLVAEIVSPSSVRMDRVMKPQVYAEAGIPNYLLVELDEPKVTWFKRTALGGYAVHGEAVDDEPLVLTQPLGVEIVPRALVAPRG